MKRRRLILIAALVSSNLAALPKAFCEIEHLPDEMTMSSDERALLDRDAARAYMVTLINRDRKSVGAPPVTPDQAANKIGQMHSDEMAVNGYLSHWTLDGRKPDQRYCEAGGKDTVAENAFESSVSDGDSSEPTTTIPLHSVQAFKKYELEKMESAFFNEKPPNDGHRQNIIDPAHTSVGIGLSFASSFGLGSRFACTQEFVNHYGDINETPQTLASGEKLQIAGKLNKDIHLKSIDFRNEEPPKPMTVAELNKTSSYSMPDRPVRTLFVDSDRTDSVFSVKSNDGQEAFSADVILDDSFPPGLYYICFWASVQGQQEDVLVACRTFILRSTIDK